MLTFAAAVFFLIITPGPGVLSTAGVGSGYGVRAATLYVGGLWLGNNLVALGVVSGLTAATLAEPSIRTILLYASVIYFIWRYESPWRVQRLPLLSEAKHREWQAG